MGEYKLVKVTYSFKKKFLLLLITSISFLFLPCQENLLIKKLAAKSYYHKQWFFKPNPLIWGDQGQFIDVGLQIDVYALNENNEIEKYIVIKTIGKGVTAGEIKYNKKKHKGLFQKAISIKLEEKGLPLKLIGLAPQTENNENSYSIATGFYLSFFPTINYPLNTTYGQAGLTTIYQTENTKTYKDFSLNVEHCLTGFKWTYWLNNYKGRPVDSLKKLKKMVYLGKIIKLPPLAHKSVLMPKIEAVYYTKEKGKATFTCEITQFLQEIKVTKLLKIKTREVDMNRKIKFHLNL